MAREAPIEAGSIGWKHLTEEVRLYIRRGASGVRTIVADAIAATVHFVGLPDTPAAYPDREGAVRINAARDAVEFAPTVRVKGVATANVTPAGVPVAPIDGTTYADGDLILLVANASAADNGPWIVHAGPWERPEGWREVEGEEIPTDRVAGTLYRETRWRLLDATLHRWRRTDEAFAQDATFAPYTIDAYTWPRMYLGVTASPGAGITVILPSPGAYTRGEIIVKAETAAITGTNPVTITRPGGALWTIDGAAFQRINGAYVYYRLTSDGTNWYRI